MPQNNKVIRITEYKNRNPKKILRELLAIAETEEMTGIIVGVRLGDWDHGIAIAGSYVQDPISGLTVAGRIMKILSGRADKLIKPGKF